MDYNFDEVVNRRNTNSYKWDSAEDAGVLPMWVADMDFRTAPAIKKAVEERASQGIYGYTRVPDEYYAAVTGWFKRRHSWQIEKDWIIYTSGVVPAVSALIKALTSPGDRVVVQTPVYNCFFSSIRNNGCEIVANPLKYDGRTFKMDLDDLRVKVSDPKVKLMLLCNPHNPAGRVWTPEELSELGTICLNHGVFVISDEIHCDLTFKDYTYTPFASISPEFLHRSATCVSPSKAFNLAGLQIASIIAEDEEVRKKTDRAININEVCDVNPFGVIATIAAYTQGEEWLLRLLDYIKGNYDCFAEYCAENLPGFDVAKLEGTYLAWMDCRSLGIPSAELEERLISEAKLWLNAGTMYGAEGEGFMRWNLACPRKVMLDGLERFRKFTLK